MRLDMGRKRKGERGLGSVGGERKRMNKNNPGQAEIIAARREAVAKLALRHFTERGIVARLEQDGNVNPDSGKSWCLGTVHGDLVALETQWRESAAREISGRKAELLAELREVRNQAWTDGDLDSVLKAVKQERDLLGLDAPERQEVTASIAGQKDGEPIKVNHGFSDPERSAIGIAAALASAGILVAGLSECDVASTVGLDPAGADR